MWCAFERDFEDLEDSVTEARIVEHAVQIARREGRCRQDLQLLRWVVECHGVERLSLSDEDSTALAARVIQRVSARVHG